MKEFIEKLIGRLGELYDRNDKTKKMAYEEQDWEKFDLFTHRCEGVYSAISIVNELAEEYKQDKTFQYVLLQTDILKRMGIDISCKWETATQQAAALNEAYLRGRQDERDRFAEYQEEYNNGWIPCSEKLPEAEADVLLSLRSLDVHTGFRSNTEGYFYVDGEGYVEFENVLAWQPLPAPYKNSV